ncbi:Cytochrome b561, eukaryote [Corchorus capsularis]|uniref:Cytochrome b561 and DOMON domain-containing protein n=1 Tax=Corchorus capsularis TaxID=210143 RepID=A0A1R3JGH7_COCAP|nr:Cytochrome b561, eukaryote [Corchorus capsularis]
MIMASSKSLLVSLLFLSFLFTTTFAAAEPCANHRFDEGKTFASCTDLPSLNFSIHWNYYSSSHTVEIAIRHGGGVDKEKPPSTWMAWAINPSSKGMVGSQSLVAFRRDDGTMAAYTSPITSYGTQLQQGNLSFPVNGLSSVVNKDNEMIIFATITLPENTTTVNHLWQEGPLEGNVPGMHRLSGPNVGSMGTLDFQSGEIVLDKTSSSRNNWKIIHGVLCTFGWGLLIPIGALVASGKQYLGQGPAWFNIHIACQCTGYFLGLVGGIIGILLWKGVFGGGDSHGIGSHQYIGIVLLCLGVIQVIVGFFFRPNKEDKKRIYFNVFHYLIGYGCIGLSIANVFLGFNLVQLKVGDWPQLTYIVAISFLVIIGAILQVTSCSKRVKASKTPIVEKESSCHIIF